MATAGQPTLHQGKEMVLKNVVNHPPGARVCIVWQRNRRRESWGDCVPAPADDSDDWVTELDAVGEPARQEPVSSSDAA